MQANMFRSVLTGHWLSLCVQLNKTELWPSYFLFVCFTCLLHQFPCSTNTAAPFQAVSRSCHCNASSENELENHLVWNKSEITVMSMPLHINVLIVRNQYLKNTLQLCIMRFAISGTFKAINVKKQQRHSTCKYRQSKLILFSIINNTILN